MKELDISVGLARRAEAEKLRHLDDPIVPKQEYEAHPGSAQARKKVLIGLMHTVNTRNTVDKYADTSY